MERSDYVGARQSFEHARARMRHDGGQLLLVVSLVSFPMDVLQRIEISRQLCQISGWKFDNLDITIGQRLCEALFATDRTKDAGKSFFELVNTFDEEVYMSGPITEWISSEFTFTCLFSSFKLLRQILPIDASPLPEVRVVQPRRQHETTMYRHLLQTSIQALPHRY
jgi:hypothetical protein